MATGGVLGNGTKVAYSSTSPVSWTRVTQVLEVGFPGLEPDEVETTVHSTSKYRRFMPGMIDVTEMTLTLEADLDEGTSPTHDALFDFNAAQTTIWWRIEVPVDREQSEFTAFEFQGWVKNFNVATPIDDKQTIEVTVRFDGDSFTKYAAGAGAIA